MVNDVLCYPGAYTKKYSIVYTLYVHWKMGLIKCYTGVMTSGSNRVSDMFILLMSFQSEKLLLFLANDGSMHSVGEGEYFQPTSAAIFFFYRSQRQLHAPPFWSKFFHFHGVISKKMQNNRLAHPLGS